jgi:AcrR family transcriptional regulator
MARTLNPEVHAVRRDTFLDAAQGLIQAKGYEQMSIQDVLDAVGTSKGAFYHYFDSKAALLESVIARMVTMATAELDPLLADPNRTALEKYNGMFQGIASWKTQRRELLLAVLETWLSDDNAIVREKFRRGVVGAMMPILTSIIRQGVTIGNKRIDQPHAAPVIGHRVNIGAGAKILGAIRIGDDAEIGANAVVLRDVPAGAIAVGVPARVIERTTGARAEQVPDEGREASP